MRLFKADLLLLLVAARDRARRRAPRAPCGGDFGAWLQGVKQEAAAHGISQRRSNPAWPA